MRARTLLPALIALALLVPAAAQARPATADKDGRPTEVHHHGMEVHRRLPDGTWVFFMDHPFGADPSWAVEAPPRTE